jgi:hypothetical protein
MSGRGPKPVSMPPDEQFHNHLSVQGKLLGTPKNQVLNPAHVQQAKIKVYETQVKGF